MVLAFVFCFEEKEMYKEKAYEVKNRIHNKFYLILQTDDFKTNT